MYCQKQAFFDLKCCKMRWRLGLRPRPRWGSLRRSPRPLIVRGFAPSALATPCVPTSHFRKVATLVAPPYKNSCGRPWQREIIEGRMEGKWSRGKLRQKLLDWMIDDGYSDTY